MGIGRGKWELGLGIGRWAWEMGIGSWEGLRVDAGRHYGDASRMLNVINRRNDGPIDKIV